MMTRTRRRSMSMLRGARGRYDEGSTPMTGRGVKVTTGRRGGDGSFEKGCARILSAISIGRRQVACAALVHEASDGAGPIAKAVRARRRCALRRCRSCPNSHNRAARACRRCS
eukprot:9504041-Pyramimonas_sp.AAC.1